LREYFRTVPRRDVDKLHEEIEELFADLWQVPRFLGQRRGFRPNVDSYHTDEPHELTVLVELPGVDPASVRVLLDGQTLVVSGERTRPKGDGRHYQQMEIEYGLFLRQVRLVEKVNPELARAEYEHGILRISLPVAESAKHAARGRVAIEVRRP
jgi:HSP20 family protein